jgi:hypothetical protein
MIPPPFYPIVSYRRPVFFLLSLLTSPSISSISSAVAKSRSSHEQANNANNANGNTNSNTLGLKENLERNLAAYPADRYADVEPKKLKNLKLDPLFDEEVDDGMNLDS